VSNESQAGSLDRGHQVGCPRLRDPLSQVCSCAAEGVKESDFLARLRAAKTGGVRPDSARLYKNIAGIRKILAEDHDVPAEVLRDMLLRTLQATEILSVSVDEMRDILEALVAKKP